MIFSLFPHTSWKYLPIIDNISYLSLVWGVTKILGISPDTLWLKLDHEFFGVPRDIYLCVAYLFPISTSYAQSIDNFTDLTSEIDRYASMGNIAVIGDLNARVGGKQETVLTSNDLTKMPIPGLVKNVELTKRNSEDKSINSRGRKFLQLATY